MFGYDLLICIIDYSELVWVLFVITDLLVGVVLVCVFSGCLRPFLAFMFLGYLRFGFFSCVCCFVSDCFVLWFWCMLLD